MATFWLGSETFFQARKLLAIDSCSSINHSQHDIVFRMLKDSSRAADFFFLTLSLSKKSCLGLQQVFADLDRNQRSLFSPTANSMYHRESCGKKSPLIPLRMFSGSSRISLFFSQIQKIHLIGTQSYQRSRKQSFWDQKRQGWALRP